MKKKRLSTAIVIIMLIIGLSLLLYPTVSNFLQSIAYQTVIADFRSDVESLDTETYDDILDAAHRYNDALYAREQNPVYLEEEYWPEYLSMLSVKGSDVMGYVSVPSVGIVLPIYHGTSDAVIQVGAGHLEGSSLPVGGVSTHAVLSSHRGLPSARLFTDIDQLKEGDIFSVHVLKEILTYQVDQITVVLPYEIEELQIIPGQDLCTLLTCTPYGINTHRMLVRGHRIETPAEVEQNTAFLPGDFIVRSRFTTTDGLLIFAFVLVAVLALIFIIVLIVLAVRRRRAARKSAAAWRASDAVAGNTAPLPDAFARAAAALGETPAAADTAPSIDLFAPVAPAANTARRPNDLFAPAADASATAAAPARPRPAAARTGYTQPAADIGPAAQRPAPRPAAGTGALAKDRVVWRPESRPAPTTYTAPRPAAAAPARPAAPAPAAPARPAQPTRPVTSARPVTSTRPAAATSARPAQPTRPVASTRPAAAAPARPAQPTRPVTPTRPVAAAPARPAQPARPVAPTRPAATPTRPVQTTGPVMPAPKTTANGRVVWRAAENGANARIVWHPTNTTSPRAAQKRVPWRPNK